MDIRAERENIQKFDPEEKQYCEGLLNEIEKLEAEKKGLEESIKKFSKDVDNLMRKPASDSREQELALLIIGLLDQALQEAKE